MSFHQEKYNQSHCADSSPSTMSDLVTLCGTRSLALEGSDGQDDSSGVSD